MKVNNKPFSLKLDRASKNTRICTEDKNLNEKTHDSSVYLDTRIEIIKHKIFDQSFDASFE